ncbi:hypothetical protein V8E52_007648 [Russula decolorans]
MMSSSVSGGATITPNTLNSITGVLASSAAAANGINLSQPYLPDLHFPPLGFEQWPPQRCQWTLPPLAGTSGAHKTGGGPTWQRLGW